MRKLIFLGVIFTLLSFFQTSINLATGFLIYNQHAAAHASAIAHTAQVDNPSAVFYQNTTVRRNRDGLNGEYEAYCSLISMSFDLRF